MFYDALLPNIVAVVGIVLFAIGAILLLGTRDRFGSTPQGARRLVWAFAISETAIVLWVVSIWVDGSGWLPSAVILAVIVAAGLVYSIPRIRRLARKHDADTASETTAHE
uniref:hypothetical protein n=1 Tax=Cryobacterium sp. TaxID=1926290 RepID=UPI0015976E7F|nr:hypothetical protein [Cryobacterium sp.]QJS06052.1 hypothetical protein [Cryobacterium sp.]